MADQVLIVDEDRRLSAMLAEYLTGYGFRVLTADTAGWALPTSRGSTPQAVILDVRLPDMDGLEALKRSRANSDVPVLMLTARADETDRIGAGNRPGRYWRRRPSRPVEGCNSHLHPETPTSEGKADPNPHAAGRSG
ncbi:MULTISPECIES: response regulator [Mesorhizobium]|uniref:response regulator n=1 Tax=Mesorhizobium TaxID=68287 RepID=UPI0003122697|nr:MULTISPECIES: response regulator [Mesorhizobium]